MNTHTDEHDTVTNFAYNPFPEPQTIPSGWDFAALTAKPEVDPVMDEGDSVES